MKDPPFRPQSRDSPRTLTAFCDSLDVTPYARTVKESDERVDADPRSTGEQERSRLAGVAATIASAAAPVLSGARRLIDERPGARVRRVRRMGHTPLVNLWDAHPDSRRAAIREHGLQSVPVEQIAGTAVEGAPQRGGDFLPLPDRRSEDWRGRWQRILGAIDSLSALPPVELIKFGDQYWVVDGHNRVGAALYTGQTDVDAIVQEYRLPGMPPAPRSPIASVLDGSLDVRNAGAGRFTRTGGTASDRLPIQLAEDPDTHRVETDE
jgi:hypothetical protein